MFKQPCGKDFDSLMDIKCSYIAFYRDMIIPGKEVRMYGNNKPWVTKSVKSSIQRSKLAFEEATASNLTISTLTLTRRMWKKLSIQ